MKKSLQILLWLPLLGWYSAIAQIRIETISVETGLSQGYVTSIIQDYKGFLWFGTYDGLNRYDGYEIRHFSSKPFDPWSLGSTYITALYEDSRHLIWVGTFEGLYVFDPVSERFSYLSKQANGLPANIVKSITGNKDGLVFVQISTNAPNGGLYKIQLPQTFFQDNLQAPVISPIKLQKSTPPEVELLQCIGDTMVLVVEGNSRVYRLAMEENQLKPFDLRAIPRQNKVGDDILWGKYSGYLFRHSAAASDTIWPRNHWKKAFRYGTGEIGIWNVAENSFYRINTTSPVVSDLQSDWNKLVADPVFSWELSLVAPVLDRGNGTLYVDNRSVLWLATGGWGLKKVNLRQLSIETILSGQSISTIRELPNGDIWLRTYADQIKILDPVDFHEIPEPLEGTPNFNGYFEILPERDGDFWLIKSPNNSDQQSRLYFWNKTTKALQLMTEHLPIEKGVPEKMLEDKDGNIWIVAHQGILLRARPGSQKLEKFNYAGNVPADRQHNLRATSIVQDHNGIIWIGTNRGLLYLENANNATPGFSILNYNPQNPASISSDWVTCISPDPHDNDVLWVGTRGGGINRLQISTHKFSFLTEGAQGLPDNVVYGILPDEQGNLWCSTNRGLCRYNPAAQTFITYQKSDGLASSEFNTGSYLRTADGRCWFGTVSGLNIFSPQKLEYFITPPKVAITGIRVQGESVIPGKEGFISLPFSDNHVTLSFAVMDYSNPQTNRFRYRVQGIDPDWVNCGTSNTANYAALPPGKYVFEVQGATVDSRWNEPSTTFTIVIRPPWYRTAAAYAGFLLLIFALFFGLLRYREKLFKLEHDAESNQRESDRLRAFESAKNLFFANIAHELRTPLTIILGLAQRITVPRKPAEVSSAANDIIKQGDQLLQLTNQMLDLAKMEAMDFALNLENGNIVDFITCHAKAMTPLATSKGIRLRVAHQQQAFRMDFDPHQLPKILNNLISNAIRHTASGGTITLNSRFQAETNTFVITIADTGEGIAREDIPHIFDRFFQSQQPNSMVGASGIGLALTRDLVQRMGGAIIVTSELGHGAEFSIALPVENNAPPLRPSTIVLPKPYLSAPLHPATEIKENMPLVLVIEDNPDVQKYLRQCLESSFQVILANDGQAGIEKALETIPDLILSDVAMPLKNGFEVTSTLKGNHLTSHIPIVLLTAKVEDDDRMEGRRRGANAYLTKPFKEEELLLTLQNLLELQEQWKKRYAGFASSMKNLPDTEHSTEDMHLEDQFMLKLNQAFEANFSDDTFNHDKLCLQLGISSSQLDRKLKALTNESPMQLLRNFRLEKAREMLLHDPELAVKEICFRTGFKSPAHFSRLYSKRFGLAPSSE